MNRVVPLAALAVSVLMMLPLADDAFAQTIGTLADIVDTAKTKSTTYGMLPPQNPGTSTVELTFKRIVSGINENTFLVDGMPTTAYRCVNEVYTLTIAKAIRPDSTPTISIRSGQSFTSGGQSGCTPGTPDGLVISNGTPSYSNASVTWNEAINSPSYQVQYRQGSSGSWTIFNDGSATTTSETVTGLAPNTQYEFRVAGKNFGLTGNYTDPIPHTTTTAVAPEPPRNLVADSYNRTNILVTWDRPLYSGADPGTGGTAITGYKIQHKLNGTNWTDSTTKETISTTTSKIIPNVNGSWWNFRVATMNGIDNSTWHDGGNGLTLNSGYCRDNLSTKAYPKGCLPPGTEKADSVPGVPTGLDVIDVVGGIPKFAWEAGPQGNLPIKLYWIAYWSGSNWARACTEHSDVNNLECSPTSNNTHGQNGRYFTARASQNTNIYATQWGDERSAVLDVGAHGQAKVQKKPTQLSGLAASYVDATTVSLDWKKPASRGSAITDYTIWQRIGPSGDWTFNSNSTSTSKNIANLDYGTQYQFAVAAANGIGYGDNSTITYTTGLKP